MDATDTKSLVDKLPELVRPLASQFEASLLDVEIFRDDVSLVVRPEAIRQVIQALKTQGSFEMMMDLFGMDYLKYTPTGAFVPKERFAVVYILYSLTHHVNFRVKAYLSEERCVVDSIHDIYRAANWFEREAWDLFGIQFNGHPNLVRILCHTDFVGHPLRKDYPSDQYQRLKNAAPSTGF